MRISNNQFFGSFLKYDQVRQKNLDKYSNQISSGKRVLSPSDDPVALAKSLKLKETNTQIENYLRNITSVQAKQTAAETALSNIYDTAQDARVEIVRLLNHGVLDQEDADIVGEYLKGLKNYIIDQANTKVGNVYLFGGTKSDAEPFDTNGKYQGNSDTQQVPVSQSYQVQSTFNGGEYLKASTTQPIKIVEVLDKITQAIDNSDLSGITEQDLADFDEGMEAIGKSRSLIGAQAANLEDFRLQYEAQKTMYNDMISKLEDANIPEAISKMEQSKVAYEASMAVFNQNKDLSLLKYFAA